MNPHKQAQYDSLKSACEEYYEFCGSEDFSHGGLGLYEEEIIEKAMMYIYDDRVWSAIREMIGNGY